MENNLPRGWEVKKLVDHVPIIKTGVERFDGEKSYYSTGSISDNEMIAEGEFTFRNRPARANRLVLEKDVVQARMRETQKAVFIDKNLKGSLLSTGFLQFRPEDNNYNSKLFYYYLRSDRFLKQRDEYATGSTQVALTDEGAEKIDLVIPLIEQQKRIVDKLDVLLTKVKDAQSRLDKIPQILNRFRQSILAVAFSGKFIETEYKEKIMGDLDIKIQTGPFGSTLHKSDYVEGGIPVINPMHIVDSEIRPSDKVTINKNTFQRLRNYVLHKGDVVLARRGEMGRCAVVGADSEGYLCGTGSLFLRFDKEKIDPYYLQMILSSPPSVNYLSGNSVGTTMQNLNQSILKEMTIPLPPLLEQKKVVRKVKSLFDIVKVIETRYHESTKYTDKLEQSILAKAFRGELIL